MARKAAGGTGNIRKKTVKRNGKEYTFWEARYTAGYDPGTGKQIQRSISGKTQKEVARKLKEATAAIDSGTYSAPCRMTLSQWMEIWSAEYLGGVKPRTAESYRGISRNHIIPCLGAVRLDALLPHQIQTFYNRLLEPEDDRKPVSAKTIKNIHGVLHKALLQAVANGYLKFNPVDACTIPRVVKKEITPLDEQQISAFLSHIKGHPMEALFTVTLFTGLRQGEALGLCWDCVDLKKGTILVCRQLQKVVDVKGAYQLLSTKNGRSRKITLAPFVTSVLKRVRREQLENRLRYADCYTDSGFVFTDPLGNHLTPKRVYDAFKKAAAAIGCPNARYHDLRHSYAVAAIRSGDDIKTVQENLGHATAAFTLDIYGHVTDQMKQESAERMERFIRSVNQ